MIRRRGQESPTRYNGYRHRRISSDFALSGDGSLHDERSKSALRRTANILRARLRHLANGKMSIFSTVNRRRSAMMVVTYFVSCVFLLWLGAQLPKTSQALHIRPFAAARLAGVAGESEAGREKAADNQHRSLPTPEARKLHSESGPSDFNGPDGIGPTLAYGIMVYQRKGHSVDKTFGQFNRMFNAMYDKKNTYVVHTDIKSDPELLSRVSEVLRNLPNAHEVESVSVSWAGITVVERTLALMEKALEVDDSWRYFVNIGHEDYPSGSQDDMRRWLKDKPDGTNFIKCWPIEGHDFFGQWEHHEGRCTDVHVDDFVGEVKEYRTINGAAGSRARKSSGYRFYKSLQQTMLSRQLSEYATRTSAARRLLLYMATSKAPDELYFPTLTQLDKRFSQMATCGDTRHFSFWVRPGGTWHPEYLTLDHLPKILNATEFYIRKVEESHGSKPLLDVLDSLREGNPIDDSLPILKAWLNRPNVEGGPIIEFTDGTAQEALDELSYRLESVVEARRVKFINAISQTRKKYKAQQQEGRVPKVGPLTKEQAERAALAEHERQSRTKQFHKRRDSGLPQKTTAEIASLKEKQATELAEILPAMQPITSVGAREARKLEGLESGEKQNTPSSKAQRKASGHEPMGRAKLAEKPVAERSKSAGKPSSMPAQKSASKSARK